MSKKSNYKTIYNHKIKINKFHNKILKIVNTITETATYILMILIEIVTISQQKQIKKIRDKIRKNRKLIFKITIKNTIIILYINPKKIRKK